MDEKKLIEAIARLVKAQVEKEVTKVLATQTEIIRAQIISEVAGMLNYSERKLLSELSKRSNDVVKNTPSSGEESDFARSMRNLKSMPAYSETVRNVQMPKSNDDSKRKFTNNPIFDQLLRETGGFTGAEIYDEFPSVVGDIEDDVERAEPWSNENKISAIREATHAPEQRVPETILGTDHKPVNMRDSKVKSVMDILNNTDFKSKYEAIKEAGNNFRDMGAAAPPRFNSEYFEKTRVD